jgi:type IV pilus assembly protein PilV
MDCANKKVRRWRKHGKQQGVGLIEVLVAVLVLSIGMLGLAGLQMRTLRNNQSSLERGVAVMETHFIADAMRADKDIAEGGGFDIALTDDPPSAPTTFADKAVAAWRANLIAAMGEGATGEIDCNGAVCDITIQWNDSRASGDAEELEEFQIATVVHL